MKQLFIAAIAAISFLSACKTTGNLNAIQPKFGTVELPVNDEYRLWQNTKHSSFTVVLTNPSATQSCEVYKVTSNGNEKWINPSLMAGKSLTFTVPSDGYVLFKNFNPNALQISYKLEE
ncbi:MAG: hypothetical protein H7178_04995 [Chitinophagaceae bacterium]|nr:hypothetical protein [Chitinophagaceae bacterium]